MNINRVRASIKYNTVYVCFLCKKQGIGDTVRVEFDGLSTQELKEFLDHRQQSARDMPVGWSFSGKFNCGCSKQLTKGN